MKSGLVFILTLGLLLGLSTLAGADFVKVGGEVLFGDLKVEGGTPGYDLSQPNTMIYLEGDVNLLLIKLGAEIGYVDLDPYYYTNALVKSGFGLGIAGISAEAFLGYQGVFFGDRNRVEVRSFHGAVIGADVKVELLKKIKIYGSASLPLITMHYLNKENISKNNITMEYYKVGVAVSPLPLVDVFVNYRFSGAAYESLNIKNSGYSVGVMVGF